MSQSTSTVVKTSQVSFDNAALPKGWRLVKLRDVILEAQGGFASGERAPSGVIQLRMNNVTTNGLFDWTSYIRVPASETDELYRLKSGDVLFNNTNSTELVGKTALFEGYSEPVVYSNHFTRLRTDERYLDPLFLSLWLQHQWRRRTFAEICNRWIGQSAVQRDKLLGLEIALPPLPEQKRIAAILKEQMTEVERARAAAEAQLKAAKDLPASYLRAVFNNYQSQQWQKKTITHMLSSGILQYHQDGNHGELHPRNKDFVPSGVKFITAKHINDDGTVALDTAPCISQKQASGLRIGFGQSSDVLLAHNATVGPVGIAPPECKPFIVGTSLTIYRCNQEHILPLYLFVALKSADFQRQLFDAMKQTTRNQVPITRQREMLIPIPTLSEQEKIANESIVQLQTAGGLAKKLEEQLSSINKLPAALLGKAFTGKL